VKRRGFLIAVAVLGVLRPASALQRKVLRVGFVYFGSRQSAQETGRYAAFLQGMRELGYIEGKDFAIEGRFADGDAERLPGLAAELVRAKVDLIVTTGTPVNHAAKKATAVIPIVMTLSVDPVADGLVQSLAQPGGNVTGLTTLSAQLSQKHVELLSALLPKLSRIGALLNPANVGNLIQLKFLRDAAQNAGIAVARADARTPEEIERSLANIATERPEALVIASDALFLQQRHQIAELVRKHRLPAIALSSEHAAAGSLMSYGPDLRDNFRRAATYVDRIFRGANPGELPIEQPAKFEMVINLRTARTLGLAIPQEMRFRADRVIE
jgi:putative tryptophan/tyrosine transport system substrate-binding protein